MCQSVSPAALTERENALNVLTHRQAERVPYELAAFQMCTINGMGEHPLFRRDGADWFGMHWIFEEAGGGLMPDHRQPPLLDEISRWRDQITFPDLDRWDWQRAADIDRPDLCDRAHKLIYQYLPVGPFERLHMLMGFENALCALLTEPEEVCAFLDALMDYKLKLIDKMAACYKPDILTFHDDYGTQQSLFFSPDLFRRIFKPRLQAAVERCHAHGMLFEMHSCGMVSQLLPDFAEIGCDSFHGMNLVDIPRMKAVTGGAFVYHCSMDVQRYHAGLAAGVLTEKEIRADLRETLRRNAEGGCYIPRPPFGRDRLSIIILEEIAAFCQSYRY